MTTRAQSNMACLGALLAVALCAAASTGCAASTPVASHISPFLLKQAREAKFVAFDAIVKTGKTLEEVKCSSTIVIDGGDYWFVELTLCKSGRLNAGGGYLFTIEKKTMTIVDTGLMN